MNWLRFVSMHPLATRRSSDFGKRDWNRNPNKLVETLKSEGTGHATPQGLTYRAYPNAVARRTIATCCELEIGKHFQMLVGSPAFQS